MDYHNILGSFPPYIKKKQSVLIQEKFDAPAGHNLITINLAGMGKGEAWVNGQSNGRYWPKNICLRVGCKDYCNYIGPYDSNKFHKNCGQPSQILCVL